MTEEPEIRREYARALERAARGARGRQLFVDLGSALGAALATLGLAGAAGRGAGSADALAAAGCAAAAVFLVSRRPVGSSAAAARLDRMLGTEAFGAALAGSGSLDSLCAREALGALRGRDPARLLRGDLGAAIVPAALGAALWIVAPLLARPDANDPARTRALAAAWRAGSTAATGRAGAPAREAGNAVLASVEAARSAERRSESERDDAAVAAALENLLRELGAAPDSAAGNVASADRLERLGDQALAALESPRAPSVGEVGSSTPPSAGGAPGSSGGGGGVTASQAGAGTLATSAEAPHGGAAVAAEPWPVRYDAVVRRYFALAAGESSPASQPHTQR